MKIKIHNDTWKIKMVDAGKKKMNPDKEHYHLGLTEYTKNIINIRKGMTKSVTRSTVIHELTHAFRFSFANVIESEESMCDFFGVHGDEIIYLTDRIMQEVAGSADNRRN